MANNKNQLTTIPLTAQLNMNRNQSQVSSSYDQLNKQNSPIYGGCISPLHSENLEKRRSLFDKHGSRWQVYNNMVKTGVYKDDEKIFAMETTDKSFTTWELKDCPWTFDDALPISTTVNWPWFDSTIVTATAQNHQNIQIRTFRVTMHKTYNSQNEGVIERTYTQLSESSLSIQGYSTQSINCFRLVQYPGIDGVYCIVALNINDGINRGNVLIYAYKINTDTSASTLVGARRGSLRQNRTYSSPHDYPTEMVGNTTTGNKLGSSNFQLIVSKPFKLNGVMTKYSNTDMSYYNKLALGITVLNHKQTGVCTTKDCWYTSFILIPDMDSTGSAIISQVAIGLHRNVNQGWYGTHWDGEFWKATNASGGLTQDSYTYFEVDNSELIFTDDSTTCVLAGMPVEHGSGQGSSNEAWMPMSVDLAVAPVYGALQNVRETTVSPNMSGNWTWLDNGAITTLHFRFDLTGRGVYGEASINGWNTLNVVREATSSTWDRVAGILVNDGFLLGGIVTNQRHHRVVIAGPSSPTGGSEPGTDGLNKTTSYFFDKNMPSLGFRAGAGYQSTATLPTKLGDWKGTYWTQIKAGEVSTAVYNSQGSYCQLNKITSVYSNQTYDVTQLKWRVLYNYRQGYVSGISWSNNSYCLGTLVTPWDVVDDSYFIRADTDWVVYRDNRSRNLTFVTTDPTDRFFTATASRPLDDILQIVAERYVIYNTTRYWNCYDIETGEYGHWASDWNNRVIGGYTIGYCEGIWVADDVYRIVYYMLYETSSDVSGAYTTKAQRENTYNNYSIASGVDSAYAVQNTFAPARQLAYNTYQMYIAGNEMAFGATTPNEPLPDGSYKMAKIDFFGSSGSSAPLYKTSWQGRNTSYLSNTSNGQLEGTTWPTTSTGSQYNNMPITGIEFINSYSGKFGVKMGSKGYSILYNGIRPVGLYNTTSMVDDIKEFFIVQSQFYAVVNNYICALSYSSTNVLNGVEQIVNVNGMQFIGAFPSVAYFYSPSNRAIFAFTGDADLKMFVQTDRISAVYAHMYAPNNEWIYIGTDDGIYIITQTNVFRVTSLNGTDITGTEWWKFFATDQTYNFVEDVDGNVWKIALEGLTPNDIEVETEFFGPGDMKQEIIDCWYIRVYKGDYADNGTVKVYVKTMTDIIAKTDEKTITITPDMWDENDNALIRYQPGNQMTQGSSLHITSQYPIAYLGFSHQLDNTTVSKLNI